MKLNEGIQINFIATKAYFTQKVTRAVVAMKRVCTAPLSFIHSKKLGKSLEKLF
jgi:hypothetical protein